MTDPTTDELAAAVAEATGLERADDGKYWRVGVTAPFNPHLDWNTLMAAVAKEEYENMSSFQRVVTATPRWHVRFKETCYSESFTYGNLESEALALAKCIYAVKKDD